jgi:hypothetical protein
MLGLEADLHGGISANSCHTHPSVINSNACSTINGGQSLETDPEAAVADRL